MTNKLAKITNMVPREKRPEIVAQLKSLEVGKTARGKPKHLTDKEIADTMGVSKEAIRDDLGKGPNKNSRTTTFVDPEPPEVIDAEVVEEPTFTCWACQEQHPNSQATETESIGTAPLLKVAP